MAFLHGEDAIYYMVAILAVCAAAFVVILVLTVKFAEAKMRRPKELEEIDERLRR